MADDDRASGDGAGWSLLGAIVLLAAAVLLATYAVLSEPGRLRSRLWPIGSGAGRGGSSGRAGRAAPPMAQVTFPSEPPTAQVTVPAGSPGGVTPAWQETGVSLQPGDILYIQASGSVADDPDMPGVSPEGHGSAQRGTRLPGVSHLALIGRTSSDLLYGALDLGGDSARGPGYVGSDFMAVMGQVGGARPLYLAVNDSANGTNSGAFTARIWVVRAGVVVTPSPVPTPGGGYGAAETTEPATDSP